MKSIVSYIDEEFDPTWDNVLEMATIGRPMLNKKCYKIAVHGLDAKERPWPHFHIYIEGDICPYNLFNFEIALDELLCYDELNIIRQKTENKDIRNRTKCSWDGYAKLKSDFEDWLYSKPDMRGDYIDNLDAIIWNYNNETSSGNAILEYIEDRGMKILPKFKKYFTEDEIKKHSKCFE